MNISSIVVQTRPENVESVVEELKNSDICDYHFHDEKGRIIVTIEGDGVKEEIAKLKTIEAMPNIVCADMQMAYSEDELEENIKIVENSDGVPMMLNDENVDPEKIVYNGDLKRKDIESFAKHLG
jgi:nitrate reductase NapD